MARLFELTEEYLNFLQAIETGDEEFPKEVIEDTLEALSGELQEKAVNIALICKDLEADVKAFKEEEDKLAARRRTLEKSIQGMKEYVSMQLLRAGITAIKNDPRARITFRKSQSIDVADETEFVRWAEENHRDDLLSYKVSVSKTAIKQSLETGAEIPGAKLVEKNSIQIK